MKLTKTNIDKLAYQNKDEFYWDDELVGFGVKVTKQAKTYIVQARVNGKSIRKKVAPVGTLTPDEARKQAKTMLGDMAKGINIVEVAKKERIKGVTLKEAYDEYVSTKKLTQSTITGYNTAMNTVFKDWHNKPLNQITGDMVVKVFKKKSAENPYGANLYFRCLRAVFNFAIENYSVGDIPLLPYNPCNKINRLKIWNKTSRRTRHIAQDQLKDFFNSLAIKEDDRPQKQLANNYITGMTQYTLKKLLNHAEDDVTAGYIQFDPEILRKPMQEIEDFILAKAGIEAKDDVENSQGD